MLGCAGHPALRHATPNIDRLAESGAYFENAYCSHPICCPSRANMWSGRYTHHCESWNNYKGLEPGMWSLLGELPKTVKNFGKLDYLSGGHSQSARIGAWLATSGINKPNFDMDKSQCFSVDSSDDPRCHECDWKYVDGAVDFLKERRDEPFFLCISTGLAHAPFRTNRYWLDRILEEAVDIPAMDNTDHPVRLYQRMTKAWQYGFDESVVRQVRRIYFVMCAEAGALVLADGELLRLRVFVDRSLVEVFANRRICLSAWSYPRLKESGFVRMSAVGGHAEVKWLNVWEMGKSSGQ